MTSFVFRLQRILQWRMTSLKTEQARLEQIRFSTELAKLEKEKLAQAYSAAKQSTENQGQVKGADLHVLNAYTGRLEREMKLAENQIVAFMGAIAKQLLVVSACDRNVRLLERLRDRRSAEWQVDMNRELDALASEFSASQWMRVKQPHL